MKGNNNMVKIIVILISFLIGSFIGFVLMGVVAANRVTEQIKINNELKYEIEKLKGGV